MFDNITATGVAFGVLLLLLGGSIGAGVLVRAVRERRYQKVAAEKS